MTVVVDASVVVAQVDGGPLSDVVADRLVGHTLVAPHLVDQEVMHALRRRVLTGAISAEAGQRALDRFNRLVIHRLATGPVLTRAWELRDRVSAYDAAYLALAEALDVPLVTLDARLGRADVGAMVEVIG